jgi:protease-4
MKYLKKITIWFIKTVASIYLAMIIFFFAFLFLLGALIGVMSGGAEQPLPEKGHLVLSFSQPLPETPTPKFDLATLSEKSTCFFDLLYALNRAAEDQRINGILLDLDNWNLSKSQTTEVASALARFKASGKPTLAYGSYIDNSNYNAAVAADQIVMPQSASAIFSLTGYHAAVPYYKELADKLGVKVNVIHIGDFKSFGENFSRSRMSANLRLELKKILDEIYFQRLNSICDSRGIAEKMLLRTQIEGGKFAVMTPTGAKMHQLIDDIDSLHNKKIELFQNSEAVELTKYCQTLRPSPSRQNIAIVTLEGDIINDLPEDSLLGQSNYITPAKVSEICDEIVNDPTIKGVILRVNSPGGSALASELILQELTRLTQTLPVYVSMGSTAASGGYYISAYASKIFAEKDTITGSIGVVSMIPDFSRTMQKIGIKIEPVTKGRHADLNDFTTSSDPVKLKLLEKAMEQTYQEFLSRVAAGRKLDINKLHNKLAQGRIWTGTQAKANGLIDELGGLNEAIQQLTKEIGLTSWGYKVFPQKKNFLERIGSVDLQQSEVNLTTPVLKPFLPMLKNIERARVYGGKPLTLLPLEEQ